MISRCYRTKLTKIKFTTSCCYRTRPSWRAEEETYATVRDDHLDGEGRELEVVVDQNPPEDEDHYQTPKLSRCNNQWFCVLQLEQPRMHKQRRSEAWASLSRLGSGQYALSLVADPESSQAIIDAAIVQKLLNFYNLNLMFRNKGS